MLTSYRIIDKIELDASHASELRKHMERQADLYTVPLITQNLPSLSGYFVTNTASLVIGGLFSYLYDTVGAARINAEAFKPLVAQGGIITSYSSVNFSNGLYISNSSLVYSINVGNESRKIVISSCTYPAQLVVNSFETTIGVNDKRLLREENSWFVEDLESGDRQPGSLKPVKQDEVFLYFEAIDFSAFYSEYRIAKFGGPFQVKDDGQWRTLYASTVPTS